MASYRLIEPMEIELYVNNNNTILYKYDKQENKVERTFRDKWTTEKLEVIVIKSSKESINKEVDLKTIINGENDFISTCEIISSTLKPIGYFEIIDNRTRIKSLYFNEFLGGGIFLKCLDQNLFPDDSNTIELLEKETPHINTLLRNLFFNEPNEILQNFLNWLNVVGFQDKHQDIIFSFFGTNEIEQGQGGGKGVLIYILNKLFSGLVQSVNNNSYNGNFNSRLQNKKIVIFDEVSYKALKYETIKDITGNSIINIEYKGKESITSKNVSSWLMFSNEWDLCNKITFEDRRTFLIRPNPKNNSLMEVVKEKYNIDMNDFVSKMILEMEPFINIISLSIGKVLAPTQLKSKAHIEYFKSKATISINDISELYKIMFMEEYRIKIYDLLTYIEELDPTQQESITRIKTIINMNAISPKVFKELYLLLQSYGYISKAQNEHKALAIFKESILKINPWIEYKINMSETKQYSRFIDYIFVKESEKKNKKTSKKLRELYGNVSDK